MRVRASGDFDHGPTLPDLFAARAAAFSRRPAVKSGQEWLDYGALNERANRLAHHLIGQGVGPDRLVGVLFRPGIDLIVALLAVLKAGGAYLPLDYRDPVMRTRTMLADAEPCLLLGHAALLAPFAGDVPQASVDSAEFGQRLRDMPAHDPTDRDLQAPLRACHAAYVIYTSGSTGAAKGVVVTHQNVVRLFGSTQHWFGFDETDVWTLFHSCCFDFSVWEIWGALLHGGCLVVVPPDTIRSPADFMELLVAERVTVLNQTPSAFNGLVRADAERPELGDRLALRLVIFGGEALEFRRLEAWYRRHRDDAPRLVNMYGITETTVHVSYLPLDRRLAAETEDSLIGEAIPDMGIHVLDEARRPVAPGCVGEIHVTGAGLARGYLNQPELTADRFVASPFGAPDERMYRTGDLALVREDGAVAYRGRIDQQVKIRGHRVETGEVAAALASLDGVADAAVIARTDGRGGMELVGYVVLCPGGAMEAQVLRRRLATLLPAHMIPAAFVTLPALPLTRNGKLDRGALPAVPRMAEDAPQRVAALPSGADVERAVKDIWHRVLGAASIGRDDNFFDLGGNSLLVLEMHDEFRRLLQAEISVLDLFQRPTVAGMAELLRDHHTPGDATRTNGAGGARTRSAQDRARQAQAALRAVRATRPQGAGTPA